MFSSGRVMFSRGVSTRVTGTDSPSRVTVGGSWGVEVLGRGHTSRNAASFVPSISSNVLHSTVDADEYLGAGLYRARLDAGGSKRRNRAAEVKARKSGRRG